MDQVATSAPQLHDDYVNLSVKYYEYTTNLTEIQTTYHDLALRYHALPLQVRTLSANDRNLAVCSREFTIPASGAGPRTIKDIHTLRQHKDAARAALRSADARHHRREAAAEAQPMRVSLNIAEDQLMIGEDLAYDVGDNLLALEQALVMHEQAVKFFEESSGEAFDDTGLPDLDDAVTWTRDQREKYTQLHVFMMRMPEVVHAVQKLGMSESAAMSIFTRTDEDRVLFDGNGRDLFADDAYGDIQIGNGVDAGEQVTQHTREEIEVAQAMLEIRRAGGLVGARRFR